MLAPVRGGVDLGVKKGKVKEQPWLVLGPIIHLEVMGGCCFMKVTDIVSPNLDMGQPAYRRNTSSVNFTMVSHVPDPPKRRGSFFGKILKAIGAFSPVGLFFGPPGWIAGAGAAGLGQIGAKMDAGKSQAEVAPPVPSVVYPNLAPADDSALATVVNARDNAFTSSIHRDVR